MNESSVADKLRFKKELRDRCISILEKRIATAQLAMQDAQESANSEEKSSAGDKYETSRAMGQQNRDLNARQLEEAQRDFAFVNSLPVDSISKTAQQGSVVKCAQIIFYISIGLGTIDPDSYRDQNQKVVLLSSGAPVAKLLEGKKNGDSFLFNGVPTSILDVF
ncbi:MAG: hypothetical protein ABI763_09210 [Bacteroidota bacterium]